MTEYIEPKINQPPKYKPGEVYLVASGDLRLSANQECWPAQEDMEVRVVRAFEKLWLQNQRAHPYDPAREHGFIWNSENGYGCVPEHPSRGSSDRSRSRLAV